MEHAIKVYAMDTATMDYFLQREDAQPEHAEVEKLSISVINSLYIGIKKLGLWPGKKDKGTIDQKSGVYSVINSVIQADQIKKVATPGGSALNTWTTVIKALKGTAHSLQLTICTTVSNDLPSGDRIRRNLESYNGMVKVEPVLPPEQQKQVQSPSSYIFLRKMINELEKFTVIKNVAKCAGFGNKEFITSEHVRESFANNRYDIVFIPGTAMEKFTPGVVECLLIEAIKQGSQIVFALPTEITPENYKFAKKIIENHATVVLGNMEELCAYYSYEANYDLSPKNDSDKVEAMLHLEGSLSKRPTESNPVAFISNGCDGAYTIAPGMEPHHTPLWNVDTVVQDPTGAGDAFNAGVLTGLIEGYEKGEALRIAAHMGSAFSDAVIKQIGAQPDVETPSKIRSQVIESFSGFITELINSRVITPFSRLTGHNAQQAQI